MWRQHILQQFADQIRDGDEEVKWKREVANGNRLATKTANQAATKRASQTTALLASEADHHRQATHKPQSSAATTTKRQNKALAITRTMTGKDDSSPDED